jgi:hypothetical protein
MKKKTQTPDMYNRTLPKDMHLTTLLPSNRITYLETQRILIVLPVSD